MSADKLRSVASCRLSGFGLVLAFSIILLLVSGCGTSAHRSISNSGYDAESDGWRNMHRELSEFDVLGIEPGQAVSEEEIASASAHSQRVNLKPGSSILLVQSGAMYPDGPMVTALSGHFNVVPFTGVAVETRTEPPPYVWHYRARNMGAWTDPANPIPPMPRLPERSGGQKTGDPEKGSYSRLLRLAAARGGGADTVICYWGILESANERMATKTISWMPFMGWVVPDECEHLRIRVKMAVIDVRTGAWTMLTPEPFEDKSWSTSSRRAAVDQKHVELLKAKAYDATAKELVERYGKG